MQAMPGKTLYDKIWDAHVVAEQDGEAILYIDLHLIHEVTTPQAFAGLRAARRPVRRPDRTLAVADHNIPTEGQSLGAKGVADDEARLQLLTLERNVAENGIEYFPMGDLRNGIVHVVGPEQGRTQPGMTIVCGDSHTSTHGAFGALAHGIGTSEVEHVLATQTLRQKKAKNMRVVIEGEPAPGVGAKDFALAVIGAIGTAGGTGYVIEYAGDAVRALSMDRRGGPPRRSGGSGRDDLRLHARPPGGAEGRGLGDGDRVLARLLLGRGCALRPRNPHRRGPDRAPGHLGHQPRGRDPGDRPHAGPGVLRQPRQARVGRTGPGVHGARSRPADHRGQDRRGLHRLVHQQPHRGSARRREGGPDRLPRRQTGGAARPGHGGARLRTGEGASGGRGAAAGAPT
jgi:hypothetical protein